MIKAMHPMVTRRSGSLVCLKLEMAGCEISVSCDDSCGTLDELRRVDVRVFRGRDDVTDEFGGAPDDGWDAAALLALMQDVTARGAEAEG